MNVALEAPIPVPPRFSVIIPLEFHRGQAVRCIRGWAEEQVFPREQFEIVIASPAGHPLAELDEIRGLLGPQDRVLEFDRDHDMDLCAKAAESARGEVLFFTESHCFPEPETLSLADAAVRENPEWAGFSCRSLPITSNLLSEIEAELYGRDIEFGMNEHPWRKVLDQCFVVRRQAYFEAGGFDPAFGHFAEWLIAARFYDLGLKIGYAPTVRIHHVYIGDFGEWHHFTADFVHGQMAYLALEPSDPLRTMFDEVPEWSRPPHAASRRCTPGLPHAAARPGPFDGGRERGRPRGRLSSLRHWHWWLLRSWLLRAVAGHSVVLMRAQLPATLRWSALQVDLLRRNGGAPRSTSRAAARRSRRWSAPGSCAGGPAISSTTDEAARTPATRPPATQVSGIPDGSTKRHGVGFHAASGAGTEAIRWSEPAAYVELPLAAGGYTIKLNWLFPPPVAVNRASASTSTNGLCPSENVRIRQDHVELHVDIPESSISAAPRLGLPPHHAEGDDRALGLPVTSLTWIREDSRTAT